MPVIKPALRPEPVAVVVSTGTADANKFTKTDSKGKLDKTLVDRVEALSTEPLDADIQNNAMSISIDEIEQEIIFKGKTSSGIILKTSLYNGFNNIIDKDIIDDIVIPTNHVMIARKIIIQATGSITIEDGSELFIL